MINRIFKAGAVVALSLCTLTIGAQQLAFPGAAGWGRFAQGARKSSSPTVYHVTNLNDSGTGSLRDAVSASNRIVVFDVAGVIKLTSGRIVFKSNLYVAGQTAPGEGVTVYGDGVSFSGSDNIICRYMRFRMGHNGTSGKDCAGVANGYNMMFDHCSFSWGLDETFSINAFGLAGNITLQNCIIGQGLMTHSAGGLMQADSITLYRNLYIDNSTRNNKVKGTNQYANNVVYNWKNGCYIMGGDSEGSSYCNIQSNLFVNGPCNGGNALGGGNSDFHFYGNDNWQDKNMDGVFDPSCIDDSQTGGGDKVSSPYNYPELELYKGNELLEKNIPTVGASLPYRDQSDCYMIDELMSYGKSGALISNEETLAIGSPSTWSWFSGYKKSDKDGDGMPDDWETSNGTDPNKADATVKASNGYLNIENYINGITEEDRDFFLRQPITLSQSKSSTSTMTLSWRDYTYAEDGFEISYAEEGTSTYKVAGTTGANATSFTINGLKDGTFYNVRVRAYGNDTYSDYATGKFSTKPIEVGIVDIDSYQPDLTNSSNGIINNTNANVWAEGRAVKDGDKLLIEAPANNRAVVITDTIRPGSIVVKGDGKTTITTNAAVIAGDTCSVNKGGAGTLVLTGSQKNTYGGATVCHEGEIQFNSIANGGVASAIGASKNFSQNWIFDGGTFNYTGANASTDRSALIKSESTLKVGTSGKTLTMNGKFEGTGNLIFDGPGQVTIGSTSFFTYTGTTTIKGGTVYLSTTDIAKAGIGKSSKLILAGGTLKTKGESSNYETYSFPIEVEEGTTSIFAPNRNCYMNNALYGAGTLQVNIPYRREYFNFNTSNFSGRIIANGVSSDSDGALMLKESAYNIPSTIVTLSGNTKLCCWATSSTNYIGGLAGDATAYIMATSKQTDGTSCTWVVGSANSDETFAGVINNRCCAANHYAKTNNFNKVGTGIWRLTGKNVYAGTTNVNEGTLVVNGSHIDDSNSYAKKNATGATVYNVKDGATLRGTGSITKTSTINIESGGTIMAGDTTIAKKTFNVSGSTMNIKSGGIMCVPVYYQNGTATSNYFNVGTLNINTGAVLKLDLQVSGSMADGTKIQVFSGSKSITGSFTTVEPAVPAEGQTWDLSNLTTDGYVLVKGTATGLDTITYSPADDVFFNLNGQKVTSSAKGIVIKNGKKIIKK